MNIQRKELQGRCFGTLNRATGHFPSCAGTRMLACCGAALIWACTAGTAPGATEVTCRENWNTVFGDRDVEFHLQVKGTEAFQGLAMVEWSAGRQAFARHEQVVTTESNQTKEVKISAHIPPVRPGVRFPVTVAVFLVPTGSRDAIATWKKTLMAMPIDPFVDRRVWFKGLKLEVWDPENKTATLLEKAELEFHRSGDLVAALGTNNTVVMGEGVSPDQYPTLLRSMVEAASKGARILCLAPATGNLTGLPGSIATELSMPNSMVFRGAGVIADMDKTLDSAGWPPDGRIETTRFKFGEDRARPVLQTMKDGAGWSWVEIRYTGGGRIFMCGFPVIDRWETNPTPRHLLLRLLEQLTDQTAGVPDKVKDIIPANHKDSIKGF